MNEEQMRYQVLQTALNIQQASLRTPDAPAFTDDDVIATADKLVAWLKNYTPSPAA